MGLGQIGRVPLKGADAEGDTLDLAKSRTRDDEVVRRRCRAINKDEYLETLTHPHLFLIKTSPNVEQSTPNRPLEVVLRSKFNKKHHFGKLRVSGIQFRRN